MHTQTNDMDWFRQWLQVNKDPLLVWNFQKRFGVEKVRDMSGSIDESRMYLDKIVRANLSPLSTYM